MTCYPNLAAIFNLSFLYMYKLNPRKNGTGCVMKNVTSSRIKHQLHSHDDKICPLFSPVPAKYFQKLHTLFSSDKKRKKILLTHFLLLYLWDNLNWRWHILFIQPCAPSNRVSWALHCSQILRGQIGKNNWFGRKISDPSSMKHFFSSVPPPTP